MGVSSIEVQCVSELEEGDHIKWKRQPGYDHHAIVEHVDHQLDKVHVIEYSSQKGKGSLKCPARIKRNTYCDVRTMFKYIYDKCLDAGKVLERARSKLGEAGYKVFKNNCEHFATWCKTGYKKCSQIPSFIRRIVNCTAEGASGAGGKVVGRWAAKCAVDAAEKGITIANAIPRLSVRNAVAKVGNAIGQNALKFASNAVVTGATSLLFEGALFGYNCYKACQNYKDAVKRVGDDPEKQRLLKQQRNKNIGEAAYEGVGATAGTVVGAAIGSFIPVVGTTIGAVVGSIGGRILGRLFGRLIHR